MRVFAAVLLSMSLAAVPLLASDATETGKEETPVAVTSTSTVPDKPQPSVKPESSAIESEVQDLRSLVEEQKAELEAQREALKAEQLKMEALEEKFGATPSEPAASSIAASPASSAAESTPAVAATLGTPAVSALGARPAQDNANEGPLFIKIGAAQFYPLGFMDLTNTYRTTNLTGQTGSTIGTSFGSIPFNNALLGRDTEDKFSAQNSRIGLRTEADFGKATHVTGYLEADFLGYLPPNGNETSNSNSLRLRLYWVDVKRGMWEILGGQSWSLLTPNRNGLSALPGDLFYGQEMDTNYILGLTWARQAGIRVIAHPTKNWAIGVSLENPQQNLPNTVAIPSNIPGAGANDGGQFDTLSGNTSNTTTVSNTSIPNLFPDVIAKTAFDVDPGGHHVHFDVAGLLRTFKAINLLTSVASPTYGYIPSNTYYSTIHGGGIAATLNVELIKNLRWITTSFYSYGGGRYIASTNGPDVIVRNDGNLSGIHSGSGISGFEYQVTPKWMLYTYYSGAYFGKNTTANTLTGTTPAAGYGSPLALNTAADRYLYEAQAGFVNTVWRNPSYGDLKIITQFAYASRTPWYVPAGSPYTAHAGMLWLDLRYDLP